MVKYYKWSDEEIWRWARLYVENKMTLMKLESILKISHSTFWWCFENRLQGIDSKLYESVQIKLRANRRDSGRKGELI